MAHSSITPAYVAQAGSNYDGLEHDYARQDASIAFLSWGIVRHARGSFSSITATTVNRINAEVLKYEIEANLESGARP